MVSHSLLRYWLIQRHIRGYERFRNLPETSNIWLKDRTVASNLQEKLIGKIISKSSPIIAYNFPERELHV